MSKPPAELQTARSLEAALAIALEVAYGHFVYLVDWDDQYVYFACEDRAGLRRRSYVEAADGSVTLGDDDDVRVRPQPSYRPATKGATIMRAPRSAQDDADLETRLLEALQEALPRHAIVIEAVGDGRVAFTIDGELNAATFEVEADGRVTVSAPAWPISKPAASSSVAELRRQVRYLTAGIDRLAARRSPAGAADADFAALTAYGPPEPGPIPWQAPLPPLGAPTPLHTLAAMGDADADFAAPAAHPLERQAAPAGDDSDYASLPAWEPGR